MEVMPQPLPAIRTGHVSPAAPGLLPLPLQSGYGGKTQPVIPLAGAADGLPG